MDVDYLVHKINRKTDEEWEESFKASKAQFEAVSKIYGDPYSLKAGRWELLKSQYLFHMRLQNQWDEKRESEFSLSVGSLSVGSLADESRNSNVSGTNSHNPTAGPSSSAPTAGTNLAGLIRAYDLFKDN